MAEIIRMPRLSDTMEEGVIAAWHKKVGDELEPGDLLAEIETDKATMEFESLWEGVLLHIEVESGGVPVNGIIAVIGEKDENFAAALEAARTQRGNGPAPESNTTDIPEPQVAPATAVPTTSMAGTSSAGTNASGTAVTDTRIKASPLARSMAVQSGIDLIGVQGSGDNGRIIKRDVEKLIQQGTTQAVTPVFIPAVSGEQYEDIPLSQMRRTIARRLGESKFGAPHFYLTVEINMDNAIAARKQINEMIAPAKISFNDLVVKSVAMALRQHPNVNSSWHDTFIRRNKQIHIGVAVAVEEGLLVPVIRNADMKSLTQLNTEIRELAGKAKDRKLSLDEMQGNTFTVSNLGMFGIEEFTAIINPPDACILAVGGISQKAIVKDGELAVGNMMKVTLSCDHRVVDGATGAKFLQTLKAVLESPLRLLA